MNQAGVFEVLSRFDRRLDIEHDDLVSGLGIYTGIGVADSDSPDIIVGFAFLAGADLEHLSVDDPTGWYVSYVWANLPGDPEVGPVLIEILEHARGENAAGLIEWCGRRFAPKSEASMAAIGYA